MKKSILLFLAFTLTACLPSSADETPAPQVTVTSEVTVTLLPPTATETLAPPTYTATPSAETVTMGGVIFTVDANGVMTIVEATGASDEIKAENLAKVDPKAWGFEAGEAEIRNIDGKIFITPEGDPDTHIAEWVGGFAGEWKWQWDELEKLPGGNPLYKLAKTIDKDGGDPKLVEDAILEDSKLVEAFATSDKQTTGKGLFGMYIYVYTESMGDNRVAVAILKTSKSPAGKTVSELEKTNFSGYIFILDENKNPVRIMVDDFSLKIRGLH
ncbi:MAG: hypothetical protein J0M11_08750 [Anaerolineae bacterium]|nr:hypothetical protein [Anaerolineae bacterium]